MLKKYVLFAVLLAASVPGIARQRTVVEELPRTLVDNNHVAAVDVVIADTAAEKMKGFDAKAAEKRASRGNAPFDPSAALSARPQKDAYATLPFTTMFPLVLQDVTREWGLTDNRGTPVKLRVTIETVKTANAAMAIFLMPSTDELAGKVDVLDAQNGRELGSFYVHVVNAQSGWGGMLMRGGGVREKLAEEFALESSRILTGSTKKDWKRRVAQRNKDGVMTAVAPAPAAAPTPVATEAPAAIAEPDSATAVVAPGAPEAETPNPVPAGSETIAATVAPAGPVVEAASPSVTMQ